MDEVLHANIFFFIASIGVVVFTILSCVGLYYVIRILHSVQRIVDRVEKGSGVIAEDIHHLRTYLAEGSLISRVIGMFFSQSRKRRRHEDEDVDDE